MEAYNLQYVVRTAQQRQTIVERMSNLHDSDVPTCTDGLLASQLVSDQDSIPNLRYCDIEEQLPTSIQSHHCAASEMVSLYA